MEKVITIALCRTSSERVNPEHAASALPCDMVFAVLHIYQRQRKEYHGLAVTDDFAVCSSFVYFIDSVVPRCFGFVLNLAAIRLPCR